MARMLKVAVCRYARRIYSGMVEGSIVERAYPRRKGGRPSRLRGARFTSGSAISVAHSKICSRVGYQILAEHAYPLTACRSGLNLPKRDLQEDSGGWRHGHSREGPHKYGTMFPLEGQVPVSEAVNFFLRKSSG